MTTNSSDKDVGYREDEVCAGCGKPLFIHEVYLYNEYHNIAAFCNNRKCARYKLLVP